MERKTKYRILGILVIIAVVIVLLPFLSRHNEFTPDTVAIKAPPFPSQTINVASELEDASPATPVQQEVQQEAANDGHIRLETDDVISATHPSVINHVQVPDISSPKSRNENIKENISEVKFVQNEMPIKRQSLVESNQRIKNSNNRSSHPNSLVDLKNILWVVQLGSFKNKENALHLVNQLRANGYHAFIQKMSNAALGEHTRVFVGPANKKTDANDLAMRLENDLHIRGIIISYKPLTL